MPRTRRVTETAEQADIAQRRLFEEMGRAAGLTPEEMERRWKDFIARSPVGRSRPDPEPSIKPSRGGEAVKITVSLRPPLIEKLAALKAKWGLKGDGEVLRRLLKNTKA